MAEAIIFRYENKIHTVSFKHSKAVLPVRLKNGECKLVFGGEEKMKIVKCL